MLAYLDCFSGISGDMLLGALLDAGFSFERLQEGLQALNLAGYELRLEPHGEQGITGKRFTVHLANAPQPERHLSEIEGLITQSKNTLFKNGGTKSRSISRT